MLTQSARKQHLCDALQPAADAVKEDLQLARQEEQAVNDMIVALQEGNEIR